jgi:hypothetical protein
MAPIRLASRFCNWIAFAKPESRGRMRGSSSGAIRRCRSEVSAFSGGSTKVKNFSVLLYGKREPWADLLFRLLRNRGLHERLFSSGALVQDESDELR